MNWNIIEGKWDHFKGEVKTRWSKLTDDDMQNLSSKKDKLIGTIQTRYGVLKDEAERQVDEWIDRLDDKAKTANEQTKASGDARH